jgi:hypothetical protein
MLNEIKVFLTEFDSNIFYVTTGLLSQDDTVEALKCSTLPGPQMAKHVQGGRPLSEPMLTPHSPQTNNGYN